MNNSSIKKIFYQLFFQTISLSEFEFWLYENDQYLEKVLKKDIYFQLISLDYKEKLVVNKIEKILLDLNGSFSFISTINLLKSGINKSIDILVMVRELCSLHYKIDNTFISQNFVFYESEFDSLPTEDKYYLYSAEYLKNQLELVDLYRADIIIEATKLLEKLEFILDSHINNIFIEG